MAGKSPTPGSAGAGSTAGSPVGSAPTSSGPWSRARRCPRTPWCCRAEEAAELSDRVYQVRCAAEDVATAVDEGADRAELRELCDALMRAAKAADGWR